MRLTIDAVAAYVVLVICAGCGSHLRQASLSARTIESIQGVGYIEPVSDLRRLSFKRTGVIAMCTVTIGEAVHKGDALMSLDSATEHVELIAAEAELKVARTERDKVKLISRRADENARAADALLEQTNSKYEQRKAKQLGAMPCCIVRMRIWNTSRT